MIIQALHQRYLNLADDPTSGISPRYFCSAKISYLLEIDRDGNLVGVRDIRDDSGKKKIPIVDIVPEQPSRSSGINPYFLSDKAEYIIGHYPAMADDKDTQKKSADARKKYEASKALAQTVLSDVNDEAAQALLEFYKKWDPSAVRDHPLLQDYMSDLDRGIDTQMAFRLETQHQMIHQLETVKQAWIRYRQQEDSASEYSGQCLLTGEYNVPIARTHEKIKGVRNAQSAGASLISFNFPSAESYGNTQSYNSPIGKDSMFGYTTALNHLLASPRNRIWIGDMTVVFWSGQAAAAEETEPFFASFFDSSYVPPEDSSVTRQLRDVLERVQKGAKLEAEMVPHTDTPFYVLGLSPNNARLAVRFFWQGHFGNLIEKLGQHAADFALSGQDEGFGDTPTAYRILAETMRVGADGKKVGDGPPPRLGGELFRSIVEGRTYPYSLYTLIINRVRADGMINRLRASILKAYLTRYGRIQNYNRFEEELTLSLNPNAQEPAYRLGRLFAVLERAQQEAAGGPGKINATIKDRYFNAASSNPAAVFPILIKLSQHHMSKARYGDFRDREMQEILQGIEAFPAHLDLQRQGLFILGYYHQKQSYFAQIKAAADAKLEAAAAEADS